MHSVRHWGAGHAGLGENLPPSGRVPAPGTGEGTPPGDTGEAPSSCDAPAMDKCPRKTGIWGSSETPHPVLGLLGSLLSARPRPGPVRTTGCRGKSFSPPREIPALQASESRSRPVRARLGQPATAGELTVYLPNTLAVWTGRSLTWVRATADPAGLCPDRPSHSSCLAPLVLPLKRGSPLYHGP